MSDDPETQKTNTRLPFEELVAAMWRNGPRFSRYTWFNPATGSGCPLYQIAEREAGLQYYPGMMGEVVYQTLTDRYDVDKVVLYRFSSVVDSSRPVEEIMKSINPEYRERVQALVDAQPGLGGER